MTHEEIISNMKVHNIEEYISLAVANDWSETKLRETLNQKYKMTPDEVSKAYTHYLDEYGQITSDSLGGNPGTKIIYNGIYYDSIAKAAKTNKITAKSLEYKLLNGEKVYVYQGRRYKGRPELMKAEGFTNYKYNQVRRAGKITYDRDMPARYV